MKKIDLIRIKIPLKINQKMYFDKRGSFQEVFLKKKFGLNIKFTAIANSKKNVIRGLHFQYKNKQSKLIHVVHGKILDIVVNLDSKSKNFGKVYKIILKSGEMLFVPDFFAHGYECLSSKCSVLYHLEKYRDAKYESGIMFNDKNLKIKWKTKKPILSIRDKNHINFMEFKNKFKSL